MQRPLPVPHNIHKIQTQLSPAELEPTIPESKQPQTCCLDSAATGIGCNEISGSKCWYTQVHVSQFSLSELYVSDAGQRHNLLDRDTDACTDWHHLTYTENYRICIMATPFSSAAVLFCTHRSTVIWTQPLVSIGMYVITTTSGKVIIRINKKNHKVLQYFRDALFFEVISVNGLHRSICYMTSDKRSPWDLHYIYIR